MSGGVRNQTIVIWWWIQPPGTSANTEYWNGTTWTEVADLGTARLRKCSGTSSSAVY
jgi:hypothetical protein